MLFSLSSDSLSTDLNVEPTELFHISLDYTQGCSYNMSKILLGTSCEYNKTIPNIVQVAMKDAFCEMSS